MGKIKKIALMSIGYIALFTCITLISALIKGQIGTVNWIRYITGGTGYAGKDTVR